MRRRNLYILSIVVIAVVVALLVSMGGGRDIPLAKARRGEFVISITRSGEIKALRSLTISAPSVGGKLLITRLIPEGTVVAKGDFIVQFDPTELLDRLEGAKRDLTAAKADLDLTDAKNSLRERELKEEIRKKGIEARKAEGESALDLENAQRELDLARMKYETEVKIMRAEVVKAEVHIARAEERLTSAERSLTDLSVTAPGDGIVVHEKVWKGGQQVKVQEGDSPWPMQPIISLPDLRTLYVATDIDEIYISRIAVGLPCIITLEAYPDTSYGGRITKIGNLARSRNYTGGPNVFDVSAGLDSIDARFRPGMKTRVEIIADVIDDAISVPIEGVFEKDGRPVVYVRAGGSFREREVEVGKRNDTHIVIRSGLEGTEEIALLDPMEKREG
ncbi:MAG: efflux RND transporter periplasmic adaptor subunit [Candidatus Eisenbacteria bacterium]